MAASTPSVTIGVPVYNGARYLADCLDSLLAQDHSEFRVLIADNASSDDTREIAQRYAAGHPRVKYHRHASNIGMYGNMHFLLRSATTPYVKLANCDDFWAPQMLTGALHVLESDATVALAYPMMTLVDSAGAPTQRYTKRLHLVESDPVVRFKRVLNEIGLVSQLMGVMRTAIVQRMRPLRNVPGEDIPFVCEMSLYGKIFQTDAYHYFRRMHPESSSYRRDSKEHQVRLVLASDVTKARFVAWRLNAGLLSRVAASPIPVRSKAALLSNLARRMIWQRRDLRDELLHGG